MTKELKPRRARGVVVIAATSIAALVDLLLAAHATPAVAQSAQAVELPPVVVEGATLAKPKRATPKPVKPQIADADDEPALKKKKASAAQRKATAKAANAGPAKAPGAETSPLPPPPTEADATPPANEASNTEAGIAADTVGTAVSVVTASEIGAQQARTGVEVLRSLPGVSISQQGGPGSIAVARIRGAESNHTLVIVDGVEMNSSIDGLYDFSNLSTADIERIEVLRGPQSGIYGSGALGGVINVVTKSGKGPLTLLAEGEAGSFNTRGGRAGISGGTDTAWGSFMVSSLKTDGIDISPIGHERDGSKLETLSLKGGVRPFANLTIRGSFRSSRLHSEYDDFSYDLPGYQMAVDAPFTSDNEMWSGRVESELTLFDDAWTQQIFLARSERDFDSFNYSRSRLIDETTKFGYLTTVRIGEKTGAVRHFLTGLVERQEEAFDQPTAANFHAERGRTSLAGEVRGEYFDMLYLGASVRQDRNEVFDDTTDWRVTGSLKVPRTPFRLHASYGTGTKLPSFIELYGTFLRYVPNPDLRPESSRGWDAGIETTFLGGRGVVDLTYFKTDLSDEITEDYSNLSQITSVNLDGKSRRQGIEASGRLQVVDGVLVGAAYTWLDALDDNGLRELRRPEHQARFDVDWRFAGGRARLNLAAIYNGRMLDYAFLDGPPFSERFTLDDYWLLRLSGSYEIAKGIEMFGRVENLLDQDYQEVFGYASAGVAAYAGMRFKLEAPMEVLASWK